MTLRDIHKHQEVVITRVGGEGSLRQHFLDMGVTPGARAKLIKFAPMGDPMQILIHDYLLTLRLADAGQIEVSTDLSLATDTDVAPLPEIQHPYRVTHKHEHPGYGEGGRFHEEEQRKRRILGDNAENIPSGKNDLLTFALAGNQNCGKTTLFNQLTGSNQHVGNFPGVTVDRKSGPIRGHQNTEVTDLPGIYSLSPYTSEEIVSREFILGEKPNGIINIIDATNIERNLYLTMQLMELNIPMVLALNMYDEMTGNGGTVLLNELERALGIPVVAISALKGEGIGELISHAIHVARYHEVPQRQDFCSAEDHGGAVHRGLHAITHLIEDHAERAGIPARFAASKVVEGDQAIIEALHLDLNETQTMRHIIRQMEEERGLDRQAAMADMRFSFIQRLVSHTIVKPRISRAQVRSNRIDRILTGRFTALPAFLCIMAFVFWFTFNYAGAWCQEQLEAGIGVFTGWVDLLLTRMHVHDVVHSLIIDGIFAGVGSVLSFLPLIVILFFFLSMLEDSGYMARIAFVTDKLLRKIGLSGRSIVPMLIGFGCSVPSIMATRTLPSARDRKLTILMIPFMSCTAKVPIYAFFCAALFPAHGAWVMMSLYLLGILMGIIIALITRRVIFRGEATPFVMELPTYRMPGVRNVAMLLWDKARDFLQRAFTVIFLASIVIWFLQTFDFHLYMVNDPQSSILAHIAGFISPVFRPLGFEDWRITTAIISGFMAKESVVSTLGTLYSGTSLSTIFDVVSGYSLLVFCLLYTPCVAAIASVRRELGNHWAYYIVIMQCLIAWVVAWLIHTLLLVL